MNISSIIGNVVSNIQRNVGAVGLIPVRAILCGTCLFVFAGSAFAGTGLTASSGTTSRHIYWTNNTGAAVSWTRYNSANGSVWDSGTTQPGVTLEVAFQGRDNTSQPWRTPSLYLKKTSDGSYIFGPEIYAAWDAQGIVPNVEYVPAPPPTPTPTPVDPASDPVAHQVHMHSDVAPPTGAKLVYTLEFTDGMHEKFSSVANEYGIADFVLGGQNSNRPYQVSYGLYDEETGALIWEVSEANSLNAELPAYDGSIGTPQTSNGTATPPVVQSHVAGSVVSSAGVVNHVSQYTVNEGGQTSTTTIAGASQTVYQGAPLSGSGSGGSFVSSVASPDSGDLADIKNLIRSGNLNADASDAENNQLLADIAESARKIAANTSPTPTPTPVGVYPFPSTGSGIWAWIQGQLPAFDSSMPQSTSSDVSRSSGGSTFWQISFMGQTVNFDPAQDSNIAVFANWVFTFLTWYASVLLFLKCQELMWQTVTEMSKVPSTDPPDVSLEALTFGGSIGILSYPMIATFVLTVLGIAYAALSTGLNTRLPISYDQVVSQGSGMFGSGSGAFGAAMSLLLWFVPVGHILTCLGVYLWFVVGRIPIYLSWRAVKTWIPS